MKTFIRIIIGISFLVGIFSNEMRKKEKKKKYQDINMETKIQKKHVENTNVSKNYVFPSYSRIEEKEVFDNGKQTVNYYLYDQNDTLTHTIKSFGTKNQIQTISKENITRYIKNLDKEFNVKLIHSYSQQGSKILVYKVKKNNKRFDVIFSSNKDDSSEYGMQMVFYNT